MKRLLVLCVLLLLSCRSVPEIRPVDTTSDQERARVASERLERPAKNPALSPDERAAIISARDELGFCRATIEKQTRDLNQCVASMTDLKQRYEVLRKDTGFLSTLDRWWKVGLSILGAFIVGTLFGRAILSAAGALLKRAIGG